MLYDVALLAFYILLEVPDGVRVVGVVVYVKDSCLTLPVWYLIWGTATSFESVNGGCCQVPVLSFV